jgi:GxxExxY protein
VYRHVEVTERIIAAFYQVYNTLGYGFLETVYQNAMELELAARGLSAIPQAPLKVYYAGAVVGEYFADFLVEECVLVELKAADQVATEHHARLLNYLKATDIDVGLLLNFGPKPEVRRKVSTRPRGSARLRRPDLLSDLVSSASKSASSAGHSS